MKLLIITALSLFTSIYSKAQGFADSSTGTSPISKDYIKRSDSLLYNVTSNYKVKERFITSFDVFVKDNVITITPDTNSYQYIVDDGEYKYSVSYNLLIWCRGNGSQPLDYYYDSGRGQACENKEDYLEYLNTGMVKEIKYIIALRLAVK